FWPAACARAYRPCAARVCARIRSIADAHGRSWAFSVQRLAGVAHGFAGAFDLTQTIKLAHLGLGRWRARIASHNSISRLRSSSRSALISASSARSASRSATKLANICRALAQPATTTRRPLRNNIAPPVGKLDDLVVSDRLLEATLNVLLGAGDAVSQLIHLSLGKLTRQYQASNSLQNRFNSGRGLQISQRLTGRVRGQKSCRQ